MQLKILFTVITLLAFLETTIAQRLLICKSSESSNCGHIPQEDRDIYCNSICEGENVFCNNVKCTCEGC